MGGVTASMRLRTFALSLVGFPVGIPGPGGVLFGLVAPGMVAPGIVTGLETAAGFGAALDLCIL